MRSYSSTMSTLGWAVVVGVLASPTPAIADGHCAAITGTGEIQAIAFPNWPSDEPVASLTGTASLQIGGGQALSLSITGEVSDMVIPADDDVDTSPTATVSVTFADPDGGQFSAVGSVVLTLPETTDLDGVFTMEATLVITGGTEDYEDLTGTITSQGQHDFFEGVGTLELSGEICFDDDVDEDSDDDSDSDEDSDSDSDDDSEPEAKLMQHETNARSRGTIACGAISPALLLLCFVGMRLMRLRRLPV